MPSSKSAAKQVRVSRKRHLHNKTIRSEVKTGITKAETLVVSGTVEAARQAVVTAISSLDKAAERGVIHQNNAARRKSRLMKKLNKASALPSTETKPEPSK